MPGPGFHGRGAPAGVQNGSGGVWARVKRQEGVPSRPAWRRKGAWASEFLAGINYGSGPRSGGWMVQHTTDPRQGATLPSTSCRPSCPSWRRLCGRPDGPLPGGARKHPGSFFEMVRIQALDLVGGFCAHTDVVLNHERRELLAVDEDDPLLDFLDVRRLHPAIDDQRCELGSLEGSVARRPPPHPMKAHGRRSRRATTTPKSVTAPSRIHSGRGWPASPPEPHRSCSGYRAGTRCSAPSMPSA